LKRFQSENQTRAEKVRRGVENALEAATMLEQTRPEEAASLLQHTLSRVYEESTLSLGDQRILALALRRRLTDLAESYLLNIPKGELITESEAPVPPPQQAPSESSLATVPSLSKAPGSASPLEPSSSATSGPASSTAEARLPAALLFYDG